MFRDQLIIDDLTGGINSKQRATKIKDNQMVSILGFDFDANSLRRAKGYTKLGTEVDSTLTGKTIYCHQILGTTDLLVKSIDQYLKFYDSVDDAWYKLTSATFTIGKRWSFVSFNGCLDGNNGTDSWIFWDGSAHSTLATQANPGDVIINLATGEGLGFPASGTIMIQNDEITYGGKVADQLTGVAGIGAVHAVGSTVILALDSTTYVALKKAKQGKNTIAFHENRNYYIDALNPNILRHSKLADNTNPETDIMNFTVAGTGAGDAGYGIAPKELIAIKEYVNGNQSAVLACFCKDGKVYAFVVTDDATGAGTTTNAFIPLRTMNSYPINPQMVSIVENDLAFVDQFGYCRTLSQGDTNTPLQVQTISELIEPSLEATFWDNGAMGYYNRKIWLAGSQTNGGVNDIYYYHDANYNAWGAYGHLDCVDFAEYNGSFYGFSMVTGDVFKLFDSYSVYVDDASQNYCSDYFSEGVTKEFNFNEPHKYKETLKLRMDGFITSNAQVYLDVYFDGNKIATFLIDGSNTSIQGATPNVAVGTMVFGTGVFGGGIPSGSVRKEFLAELQFGNIYNFLKTQFKFRMTDQETDFEMTNLSLFAKLKGTDYWLSNKIITQV